MIKTFLKIDPGKFIWLSLFAAVMLATCPVMLADDVSGHLTVAQSEDEAVSDPDQDIEGAIRDALAIQRHPTDPSLDGQIGLGSTSAVVLMSHGSAVAQSCNCGHCLRCVDRNGKGMIGELGMKNGIGPCIDKDTQCWQCPYDAPFDIYGPGEYAGPARTQRVFEYRLRSGDVIDFTFMTVGFKTAGPYRLVVGDELMIASQADEMITLGTLERGIAVQPDGTITLSLIGQIYAVGQTVEQLRDVLNEKYSEFYEEPNIDVIPVSTGTAGRRVREAISGQAGFDPQRIDQTISPSGEIRLPRLGKVQAQGLTIEELKQEINLRYDEVVGGLEVEPALLTQAPHNVFVLGEVNQPGRFSLNDSPTTVLGAIAMAGGHVPGANLRQVVVFRRGENFELLTTLLDVRGAILGREAHPADEIWLRDGDVIVLPSTPIRLINNLVRQVFTEGIYGVVPFQMFYDATPGAILIP